MERKVFVSLVASGLSAFLFSIAFSDSAVDNRGII